MDQDQTDTRNVGNKRARESHNAPRSRENGGTFDVHAATDLNVGNENTEQQVEDLSNAFMGMPTLHDDGFSFPEEGYYPEQQRMPTTNMEQVGRVVPGAPFFRSPNTMGKYSPGTKDFIRRYNSAVVKQHEALAKNMDKGMVKLL